jgi:cathepsin B
MARVASLTVAFSCVGAAAAADGKTMVNDPRHLEHLDRENVANTSWTAGFNSFFEGLTFDAARPLLGTALSHISEHMDNVLPDSAYDQDANIPAEFDARTKWPGLIHPIRDQQRCGSCWAFSASEVLGDRVAIATGKPSPVLSPEDMVSCDGGDMGCGGGRLNTAWSYLKNTGVVSEKCLPYAAGDGQAPVCPSSCADGESWNSSKVKAATAYAIHSVSHMQQEIMTKGPIQVAFMVYKSFMSYKSGVYQKHWNEFLPEGGHAVKIIGWGTENGVDYWLVANSWNTSWGLDGYFKIKRGRNTCGIEKTGPPYAGTAAASEFVV